MRKQGLVSSARGPGGGYRLSRDADDINIAQVIEAVDEKVSLNRCEGRGDCHNGGPCLTHELWCNLSDQIYDFLNNISLGKLVQEQHVKDVAARQNQMETERQIATG